MAKKYKSISWYTQNDMLEFLKKNKKIPAATYAKTLLESEEYLSNIKDFFEKQDPKKLSSVGKRKALKSLNASLKKYLKLWNEANSLFENIDTESIDLDESCYNNFYIDYACAAYRANDKAKMDFAISFLKEDMLSKYADAQLLYYINYAYKAKDYASSGDYQNAVTAAEKALAYLDHGRELTAEADLFDWDNFENDLKKIIKEHK